MRLALAVLCATALAAAAGCGGGGAAPRTATPTASPDAIAATPAAVESCASAGAGWREPEGGADAAALGHGPTVVFLNDSSNDTCPWMAPARAAAGAGRTAVVLTYRSTDADGERAAVRDALAAAGDGPFVLVGASLGGRIVFEAAARAPEGLAGIVSLSGERRIDDYRDILPDVRRVAVPVLYAGTREDSLTDGARQPRQLRAALPGDRARFLILPGFAHGTELLEAPRVRRAVDRFLDRTLG